MMRSVFLGLALFASSAIAADGGLDITYSYSIPYAGGATLTIKNNSEQTLNISQLKFSSNGKISGNPWGTLWGWESSIDMTENSDGINNDFVINESPTVSIPPAGSAELTYNVDQSSIGGVLTPNNAVMDPINVAVVLSGETEAMEVEIDGKCQGDACNDPGNGKRITGYFPNWAYWRSPKFTAEKLQYDKVNSMVYAFFIMDQDGTVSLYDKDSDAYNLPIISQARKKYPYLNAAISFGGWSWASTPSGWGCKVGASPDGPAACFRALAANSEAVDKFAKNAVAAMKEVHFNGIDIDWEYPASPEDAANYVNLLQKVRAELDAQSEKDGVKYYLTVAVGAGVDKIQQLTPENWQQVAAATDYVGIMTYDFHGDWDAGNVGSDFQSAMQLDKDLDPTANDPVLGKYNVTDSLNLFVENGVPTEKLLVGIPVYGRMVNIDSAGEHQGLYQTITGTPLGEWDNQQSGSTGMLDYNCIVDASSCGNSFQRPELSIVQPSEDNSGKYSKTPWGFSDGLFVTYDDEKSAEYKANWVLEKNFGGVMLWDLTGDFEDSNPKSIIYSIHKVFNLK